MSRAAGFGASHQPQQKPNGWGSATKEMGTDPASDLDAEWNLRQGDRQPVTPIDRHNPAFRVDL